MKASQEESKKLKKTLSFRVDEELYSLITASARRAGESPGSLFRLLLSGKDIPLQPPGTEDIPWTRILGVFCMVERRLERITDQLLEMKSSNKEQDTRITECLEELRRINEYIRKAAGNAH